MKVAGLNTISDFFAMKEENIGTTYQIQGVLTYLLACSLGNGNLHFILSS